MAGLWKLEDDALVVEAFDRPPKRQRDEIAAEGERMLATMHPGTAYDVRFGTVRD